MCFIAGKSLFSASLLGTAFQIVSKEFTRILKCFKMSLSVFNENLNVFRKLFPYVLQVYSSFSFVEILTLLLVPGNIFLVFIFN